MSVETATALERLLAESLRFWRVPARVSRTSDGALTIAGLGHDMIVAPAAPGLPFRWMVTVRDGETTRQRPALSVVSVLRQVRLVVDPAYAKQRLRVAPLAVTVPSAPALERRPT